MTYNIVWFTGVPSAFYWSTYAPVHAGQHPLKDYPEGCESAGRVKYRSVSYQVLPDPNQVGRVKGRGGGGGGGGGN